MSEKEEGRNLDWKDYLAIIIAMLSTNLLPIIIIVIFLVIVALVL